MGERHVTVVGAGIVGIACAAALQRDGHRVTVVDPRGPGTGCSWGNAGVIAPGACLPLAMPGLWRRLPGYLLDPLGPLTIDWRHAPKVLPWLAHWLRASRTARVREISAAMRALHRPALDMLRELLKEVGGLDLLRQSGQLYVSASDGGAMGSRLAGELLREAGVRAEAIGPDELRQLEPALSRDLRSGLFFPDHGHVRDPFAIVTRLAEGVVRNGGQIVRDEIVDLTVDEGGVVSVIGRAGPRTGDLVVLAAGSWSAPLARRLGARIPLIAERGYHVTLPHPGRSLDRPVSHVDRRLAATPMAAGLRFAGTVEIAAADAAPRPGRARAVLAVGTAMVPGVDVEGATEWMGARPSTPDGLPVIGRAPRVRNAVLAFGHAHYGLMGAAPTGRLVADLVAGRRPFIDPAAFRPERFA